MIDYLEYYTTYMYRHYIKIKKMVIWLLDVYVVENTPNQHFVILLREKTQEKTGHAQNILPDSLHFRSKGFTRAQNILLVPVTNVTSGHVTDITSGSTPEQHPRNDDLSCSHILLSLCLLTPQ